MSDILHLTEEEKQFLYGEDWEKMETERKLDELEAKQLVRDFRDTFLTTDAGRRVLRFLLIQTRVFQLSFTGNNKTFFLEGMKAIGLMILDFIEWRNIAGLMGIDLLREKYDGRERREDSGR